MAIVPCDANRTTAVHARSSIIPPAFHPLARSLLLSTLDPVALSLSHRFSNADALNSATFIISL